MKAQNHLLLALLAVLVLIISSCLPSVMAAPVQDYDWLPQPNSGIKAPSPTQPLSATGALTGWPYSTTMLVSEQASANVTNAVVDLNIYYGEYNAFQEDGAFEWFVKPAFHYVGTYDRTYIGYVSTDSTVNLRYWDEDDDTRSDEINLWSSWGSGDDHACPSVIVLSHQTGGNASYNGRVLVAVGEHSDKLQSRLSQATELGANSTFDTAVVVEAADVAYANLIETDAGTVWLFYRLISGGLGHQYYRIYDPSGDSWSARTQLTNDIGYAIYWPHGNDVHVILNDAYDDDSGRYKNIWYGVYDASDSRWEQADGDAYVMPIDKTDGDLVHATTAGHWEYLWDIKTAANGTAYLISLDDTAYKSEPGDVLRHYWNGSAWVTETVASTAGRFGTHGYFAGAVLDQYDTDKVYAMCLDAANLTQLQVHEKSGGSWSKTADITENSDGEHFRPMTVFDGAGSFKILWCYTERYTGFNIGEWGSTLMAYPGFNNQNNFSLQGTGGRTDFQDIRFTTSDMKTLQPAAVDGKPWFQEVDAGFRCKAWLGVGNLVEDTDTTFGMHWGNAAATNANDQTIAEGNFPEFVDIFAGSAGNPDTATRWTIPGGGNDPQLDGSGNCVFSADDQMESQDAWGLGYEQQCEVHMTEEDSVPLMWRTDADHWIGLGKSDADTPNDFNDVQVLHKVEAGVTNYVNNQWHTWQNIWFTYYLRRHAADDAVYGQNDNGAYGTLHSNTLATNIPDGNCELRPWVWDSSAASTVTMDWIFVRVSTNPMYEVTEGGAITRRFLRNFIIIGTF